MRMTINDGHGALLRGLRRLMESDALLAPLLADRQIPSLTVEGLHSEPWASATFTGQRHKLDLKLRGEGTQLEAARERLVAQLGEADLDLRGHVLVDLSLAEATTCSEAGEAFCRLSFEALTVED